MTDKQYEPINEEPKTTVTIDDVLTSGKTARPNRGKSQKQEQTADQKETPKKPETKRADKLNGKDVEEMFEKVSKTAVYMGAQPFWYIEGEEVHGFSSDMADMLNRIPAHYVTGVFNFSGYLTVAYGLLTVFKPRISEQRRLDKQSKNGTVTIDEVYRVA